MRLLATSMVVLVAAACSFDSSVPSSTDDPSLDATVTLDDGAVVVDAPTIDAAPVDAETDATFVCPVPPAGCTDFSCPGSASCYFVCDTDTFAGAQAKCTSEGIGCLATVNINAENDCITNQTGATATDGIWIGYQQARSGAEPLGGWDWLCGSSTYTASNWGGGEPNNFEGNEEDCTIVAENGTWQDRGCGASNRFVCELVP